MMDGDVMEWSVGVDVRAEEVAVGACHGARRAEFSRTLKARTSSRGGTSRDPRPLLGSGGYDWAPGAFSFFCARMRWMRKATHRSRRD